MAEKVRSVNYFVQRLERLTTSVCIADQLHFSNSRCLRGLVYTTQLNFERSEEVIMSQCFKSKIPAYHTRMATSGNAPRYDIPIHCTV